MAEKHATTLTIYATVTINDPEVIERVTGPGGDEWRSYFYDLHTREDVIEHFVGNWVLNGVTDVGRLEGWADVVDSERAVMIEFESSDYVTEALP